MCAYESSFFEIQEFGFDSMERLYLVTSEDLEELTLTLSSPTPSSSSTSLLSTISSTSQSVKMTRGEKRVLLSELAKESQAQDREDNQLSASAATLDLSCFRYVEVSFVLFYCMLYLSAIGSSFFFFHWRVLPKQSSQCNSIFGSLTIFFGNLLHAAAFAVSFSSQV